MGGTKGSGKLGRNYKERMFRLISKHRKKSIARQMRRGKWKGKRTSIK